MARPLEGISVLDFTTLLPGPLATLILAEAGASVTKIERPGGEDMRRFPPFTDAGSAAFAALNAGKRSIFLDLKAPDARAVLEPLIASTDIVVEQFRPGVMARLGFGYDDMRSINQHLIFCSITGFGQEGPRAREAGHDITYLARTGLLSLSPGAPQAPTVPPALFADIGGGSFPAVISILLALRQRDLTGRGAHIDIAMTDAMATFAWHAILERQATGKTAPGGKGFFTGGQARYRLYATADGRFLAVGALEQKFWESFCAAIGLPADLRDDARTPERSVEAVAAIIGAQPAIHWQALLDPLDCCCCVVATLEEAMTDPHFRKRGLFQHGRIAVPGLATAPEE